MSMVDVINIAATAN